MKSSSLPYGILALSLLLGLLLISGPEADLRAAANAMTVYKDPSCGCCGKWVEHLRQAGFQVTVREVSDTAEYSRKAGVPAELRSCHVGLIDGYAIEGHVPAADIQRLLKERPQAKGLAAPGMPTGAPGMEQPSGRSNRYSVMLFTAEGKSSLYKEYPAK